MRGVNKVILVGTLGRDPETKTFPNGGSICQFSIATSESWMDKTSGERQEITEWHRINISNRLGEIAQQYLRKGSKVYIEGSLRTRKWTDKDGVERYATEIRADSMHMIGDKPNPQQKQNSYSEDNHPNAHQNNYKQDDAYGYHSEPSAQPQRRSSPGQSNNNNRPSTAQPQSNSYRSQTPPTMVDDRDLPF